MPTLIRIKETGLKIEKKKGITKISINTLYLEKGFQVADVIAMFNTSLAEAEQRVSASIDAEAQLRIAKDMAFSSYLVNLETKVNDNAANVTTQISTLTTDISTVASSVTQLEVTLNGTISAALTEQATVMAGYFSYWDGTGTPKIGNLKLVDGVTYQYVSNGTWRRYDEGALGVANQVKGWVAGASSLVVDPSTGNVTGWQYGDGSGFNSYFKINAQHIELAGSTTFSNFAMKDMSNVTTIDGGKITTNTLNASAIQANTLTGDMIYGGIIYNVGANDSNYTMKINLNAGEIHIR